MLIIKAKGFKTTIDSLTNQVVVTRRKLNLGPSKRKTKVNDQSVSILQPTLSQPTEQSTKTVTSPKIAEMIAILDDTITNLGLVKLALQEINDTSELLAKISELMKK